MAKCKSGFKMNKEGDCVRTKTSRRARNVGRALAGILTWGASEAIIKAEEKGTFKKKKTTKSGKKYAAK
tara:strand:- start:145 stop:351 length:207 start_codon:yes stop_codon:yes gene_type:complete